MNLIRNEFLKLHAKKGSYIFAGVLVIISIGLFYILKNIPHAKDMANTPLEYAAKTINPLFSLITLYGVVIAGKSVSEEFQKGTIKQLLIRPKKRIVIWLSKYVTNILVLLIMVVWAATLSILFGALGFSGNSTYTFGLYCKEIIYELPSMIFYTTLAFALGTFFRNAVVPIAVTLFLMFSSNILMVVLSQFSWAKWLYFYHFDLMKYDKNPIINPSMGKQNYVFENMSMGLSISILICYMFVFLVLSGLLFRRRDIL